ncbi:MAG: leucine-rich repeat domain-containing protein [Clostridia bacterium]|nr:leucine-rich repeat domain-containing protein [Clostridia bacterium]
MARQTSLPKPDVGGTMSRTGRVVFIIFLIIVLSASVSFSFNSLSRKTYEFEYTEDYNGTGRSGYVFDGFNGNASITEIHIAHPVEKRNGEWVETEGDVIAVSKFTVNSDEYLKYIYIGPTVEYIEDQAFVYCRALRAFYVDENNPSYCSINGVLYNKDMTEIISYPICHCTQVVIDDVRADGEVKNIGRENVESFSAQGVYVKGDEAKSTLFTSFRNYIKSNYSGDFDYLNEFSEFSELMDNNVYAPYIGTYYLVTENTGSSITVERFWTCDEKYEVPEGVTKVANKAFYKCDRLVSITLPSTVKSIGDMAFFKCGSTSLVNLPDGLETIGNDAFSYCENMKYAMFIPASVTHIGHHCFYKCSEDMLFYMGSKDASAVDLGGKWQPRNDNSFKPKNEPVWGSLRADCDKFNSEKYAQDEAQAAKDAAENPQSQDETQTVGGMNKKALTALIACFIPCFGFIGLQIIRNVFKDDFLMTRRGKEKLAKRKEENERIHQAYINGEFDVPETPAQDETPAEEPEKEETAHSREQDGENEGGESE